MFRIIMIESGNKNIQTSQHKRLSSTYADKNIQTSQTSTYANNQNQNEVKESYIPITESTSLTSSEPIPLIQCIIFKIIKNNYKTISIITKCISQL